MAFDPTTAKAAPITPGGFDPSTAKATPTTPGGFDPSTASETPVPARGYVSAFASGIPEALWGVWGKGLSLAAAAPAMGVDKLRGMVTGKETTAAQDWVFKNMTDAAAKNAEAYALTPEEAA
ncbi:MAG: hypothetical protein ACKO0Z_21865, partial [Betaproteobacteria bacterium]